MTSLVGDGVVSSPHGSDGVRSSVEGEPLLVLPWGIISDSESILVSSNVFGDLKSSVGSHSRSDSESDSIGVDWSSSDLTSGVKSPTLVGIVVAVPVDNMSSVSVRSTMNIKALSSVVLDVSSASVLPSESDGVVGCFERSHDSSLSNSESLSSLVSEGPVSL